jgi:hypothetical protein
MTPDIDRLRRMISHRNECLGKLKRLNKAFIEAKGYVEENTLESFMKKRELLFDAFNNINISIEKCRLENDFDKHLISGANNEGDTLISEIVEQDSNAMSSMQGHMKELGGNLKRVKDIKTYEKNSVV